MNSTKIKIILFFIIILSGYSILRIQKNILNQPKEKVVFKYVPTPKPTEYYPDNDKVELYADYLDVPYSLVWACYMAEQGVDGYNHGQRRISGEITVLFPQDMQLAQSCRTLRNSKRAFIKLYPEAYAQFKGNDAEFLEKYITKFVIYLRDVGWNPAGNKVAWQKNVMFFYKKYKKDKKSVINKPKTLIVR